MDPQEQPHDVRAVDNRSNARALVQTVRCMMILKRKLKKLREEKEKAHRSALNVSAEPDNLEDERLIEMLTGYSDNPEMELEVEQVHDNRPIPGDKMDEIQGQSDCNQANNKIYDIEEEMVESIMEHTISSVTNLAHDHQEKVNGGEQQYQCTTVTNAKSMQMSALCQENWSDSQDSEKVSRLTTNPIDDTLSKPNDFSSLQIKTVKHELPLSPLTQDNSNEDINLGAIIRTESTNPKPCASVTSDVKLGPTEPYAQELEEDASILQDKQLWTTEPVNFPLDDDLTANILKL